MKKVISIVSILALWTPGILLAARPCSLGLSKVEAIKTGPDRGIVRVRVSNGSCPEGYVRVSVGPFGEGPNLKVIGWPNGNVKNVTLSAPGVSGKDETLEFMVEGSGPVQFHVAIDSCNGQSCEEIGWAIPRRRDLNTEPVTFP